MKNKIFRLKLQVPYKMSLSTPADKVLWRDENEVYVVVQSPLAQII